MFRFSFEQEVGAGVYSHHSVRQEAVSLNQHCCYMPLHRNFTYWIDKRQWKYVFLLKTLELSFHTMSAPNCCLL
jgi:hypothetical protein